MFSCRISSRFAMSLQQWPVYLDYRPTRGRTRTEGKLILNDSIPDCDTVQQYNLVGKGKVKLSLYLTN
jgi:hypothetical protein